MNLHLSVFRPYQRDAHHEDQLTRGAIVVMKLVPLAHDAFLELAAGARLGQLPPPRYDMQTGRLTPPAEEHEDEARVDRLVSVFLGPHESLPSPDDVDVGSPRSARYDGVLQYGSRLMIVVESKLFDASPDWQSVALNLGELQATERDRQLVSWNVLLDRWWSLMELEILTPTERSVLTDFFDFAEENFGWLLPFTELARCGENPHRQQRRLRGVLGQATQVEAREAGGQANVMFPDGVTSVQRVALFEAEGDLVLGMWPAELTAQARHVYGKPDRVEALARLDAEPGWSVRPNFHLSYYGAPPRARWYTTPVISGPDYLRQWAGEDLDRIGRRPRDEIEDPAFWHWAVERGYAESDDRAGLERLLSTNAQRFDVRPSVAVARRWPWQEAVELDSAGRLVEEVSSAIDAALSALEEPSLSELQPVHRRPGSSAPP